MNREPASTWLRLSVHLLLAAFMANAANKFFVADLDYEMQYGFYARIFDGVGDAPDQYRILPLLPLKLLCTWFPFNTAVLLYNFLCGFILLELFALLTPRLRQQQRFGIAVCFTMAFIYTQYTGWRPDTLALVLVCTASLLAVERAPRHWRPALAVLGITLMAFCRADMALALGWYIALYKLGRWPLRWGLFLIPIAVQVGLMQWVFPEAKYYTDTIMLADNLRGYYLLRNPATYLIPAVVLAFWGPIRSFFAATLKKYLYFYIILGGYIVLVLFVGRINEYRLYLPFLPVFLSLVNERFQQKID